jgi:hypothetical protein
MPPQPLYRRRSAVARCPQLRQRGARTDERIYAMLFCSSDRGDRCRCHVGAGLGPPVSACVAATFRWALLQIPTCRFLGALTSGRGSAWLERLVRDQEVGGSNPLAPTNFFNHLQRRSLDRLVSAQVTKHEAPMKIRNSARDTAHKRPQEQPQHVPVSVACASQRSDLLVRVGSIPHLSRMSISSYMSLEKQILKDVAEESL